MATHQSPKGRPVEVVLGRADDIQDRGTQIVNLGASMIEATTLLTRLVEGGADMEGEAIAKLQEVSAEVYVELGRAGSLYESVGPYVRNYGSALATVQSAMSVNVPAANAAWQTYQQRVSDLADAQHAPIVYHTNDEPSGDDSAREDAEEAHADGVADATTDKNNAYNLWKQAGDDFDANYDSWESAFNDAVTGIRSQNSDGIADDWRDDVDGFIEVALQVLAVAGLVLAVLALIVGGPIVALLAVLVGVLTLVGTLWQYGRGDAELWEVGIAVLGVIPFGAIGEFASGGFGAGMRAWGGLGAGGLSLGDDAARWSLSLSGGLPDFVTNMRTLGPNAGFVANSFDDIVSTLVSGQDVEFWEVLGDLGTSGQQAAYAFAATGILPNTIATVVGGVTDAYDLVSDLDWLLYPTW